MAATELVAKSSSPELFTLIVAVLAISALSTEPNCSTSAFWPPPPAPTVAPPEPMAVNPEFLSSNKVP